MSVLDAVDDLVYDLWERVAMPVVILVLCVLVIVGIPVLCYAVYLDMKSPTFSLDKDEWTCTASVERSSTTYVKSGEVLVPITSNYKHCTQWSEKP